MTLAAYLLGLALIAAAAIWAVRDSLRRLKP